MDRTDRIQSQGCSLNTGTRFSGILPILFILSKIWIEPCRPLCALP